MNKIDVDERKNFSNTRWLCFHDACVFFRRILSVVLMETPIVSDFYNLTYGKHLTVNCCLVTAITLSFCLYMYMFLFLLYLAFYCDKPGQPFEDD